MTGGVRLRRLLLATLAASLAGGIPLDAQERRHDPRLEGQLLREASSLEASGDLAGAEATLRQLLEEQPGSSSAVFALERVLRARGDLSALLPVVDAHLEVEPASGAARFLKVRVLAEVDSLEALEPAVEAWIRAEPSSPDPYREGAELYRERLGADEAVALVQKGLSVLRDSPVLLIELGDLQMAEGRTEEGARAWARALGQDRAQTQAVFRRLDELDDGEAVAARIVTDLGAEPTSVARLEVGSELALRSGLEDEAQRLATAATERLEPMEAKGFLNGFARKAEDLSRTSSALWAYRSLRERVDDPVEGRSTDERLAAAALQVGDSVAAFQALRRIRESHPRRSVERQAAWADELRVHTAVAENPEELVEALDGFREEFPGSPALDDLSATVASRLLGSGERETAMSVLNGIEGPGATLERAYLLLENGALGEGIQALREAVPSLDPSEATEVIHLTLLLSRLSPAGAQLAAQVAIHDHRGNADRALQAVREGVDGLPLDDRAGVLALGARTADRGGEADAAVTLRRLIVREHSNAPEMPDAALRLARALGNQPQGQDEAIQILEALILGHPSSPVVPDARRELRRLQETGS